jgi:hypothetical protein
MDPNVSVIVPVHDDVDLIAPFLRTLLADARPGEFDVVVVCNGCTDDSAARARCFSGVRVVEIPEASKFLALRAGDAALERFPRLYVDVDVALTTEAARALVDLLRGTDVEAAAPRLRFDATHGSRPLQAYMRVASRLPVFGDGYVGSGVYGLSRAGRERFGAWPLDLPDDALVQRLVPPRRRATSPGDFVVKTPTTLAEQVRRQARIQRLNRALERCGDHRMAAGSQGSTGTFLAAELCDRTAWWPVAVFVAGQLAARLLAALDVGRGRQTWRSAR